MIYLLTTIHVIVSIFLILVVLLQQGKGADLSVFGGGSTQSAFGARGAATLLHKLTVTGFVLFVLTTIGISLMQGSAGSSSVLSEAATEEAATDDAGEPAALDPVAGEAPVEAPADAATDATPADGGTAEPPATDDPS